MAQLWSARVSHVALLAVAPGNAWLCPRNTCRGEHRAHVLLLWRSGIQM
ncbi:MAG: hypothetical protein ACYDBA_14435 [Sulfuricaulis sp.]